MVFSASRSGIAVPSSDIPADGGESVSSPADMMEAFFSPLSRTVAGCGVPDVLTILSM